MQKLVTELQNKLKSQFDSSLEYKRDSERQIEDLQAENSKLMDMIVKYQIHSSSSNIPYSSKRQAVSPDDRAGKDPRSLLKYAAVSSKVASKKNNRSSYLTAKNPAASKPSQYSNQLSPFITTHLNLGKKTAQQ